MRNAGRLGAASWDGNCNLCNGCCATGEGCLAMWRTARRLGCDRDHPMLDGCLRRAQNRAGEGTMGRDIPPWPALEAFVVAARCGSFRQAAEQLGLSAPAFTRRIQTLEHHV